MTVRYTRGGGQSVPKEVLRYINKVAEDLARTANRDLNVIVSNGSPWLMTRSYVPGSFVTYNDRLYQWTGDTGSTVGTNPTVETGWNEIT